HPHHPQPHPLPTRRSSDLASETRGGTILQLCLYSELVAGIQGRMPDHTHVVSPGRGFQPETFRPHDFLAYYRFVKSRGSRAGGTDRKSTRLNSSHSQISYA